MEIRQSKKKIIIRCVIVAAVIILGILAIIIYRNLSEPLPAAESGAVPVPSDSADIDSIAAEAFSESGMSMPEFNSPLPEPADRSDVKMTDGENADITASRIEISGMLSGLGLEVRNDKMIPVEFRVSDDFWLTMENNSETNFVLRCESSNGTTNDVILYGLDVDGRSGSASLPPGTSFRILPGNSALLSALPLNRALHLTDYSQDEEIRISFRDVIYNNTLRTVYIRGLGRTFAMKPGDVRKLGMTNTFYYSYVSPDETVILPF